MAFSVHVPGSSANLGPGFDCLGLALDLWLRVDVTPRADGAVRDAGSPDLLGGSNLVIEAMRNVAERRGFTLPGCEVAVSSAIPVARGLGSSAAAIVAGMRAASVLAGYQLSDAALIQLAGDVEGHADNVSASVLGGATVSLHAADGYLAESLALELPWTPVVFIPDRPALTYEARGLLPGRVPMSDAAANLGHAALLAYALHAGRGDLLREAMSDRLHQPYRARIFPHLEPCIAAALAAGAAGAALSGAGPTILALASPAAADAVASAMMKSAGCVGVTGAARTLAVARRGCHVSEG
jgi:homoserine kinase